MSNFYNSQSYITSHLRATFDSDCNLSKPHATLIPHIIYGIIKSESVVTSDIVKKMNGAFDAKFDSTIRRLERFFNNTLFLPYNFYSSVITHIVDNYVLKNPNVYISFDHMFCRNAFTIFLISLRIGRQGIPLWFRCFKGKKDPEAFSTSTIIEGIDFVYNIFKDKDCSIIFLDDRWFPNVKVFEHINSLSCCYCIRTKGDITVSIPDSKKYTYVEKLSDIAPRKTSSLFFENVTVTKHNFRTNVVISKSDSHKEPFFLLTNDNVDCAVKHYGYRFGSIECIFKNQKSNGFYLEATKMKNIHAFTSMFTLTCVALIWIIIIGVNYSKNKKRLSSRICIRNSYKSSNSNTLRISYFNVGLIFINLVCDNGLLNLLRFNFKLYDV